LSIWNGKKIRRRFARGDPSVAKCISTRWHTSFNYGHGKRLRRCELIPLFTPLSLCHTHTHTQASLILFVPSPLKLLVASCHLLIHALFFTLKNHHWVFGWNHFSTDWYDVRVEYRTCATRSTPNSTHADVSATLNASNAIDKPPGDVD